MLGDGSDFGIMSSEVECRPGIYGQLVGLTPRHSIRLVVAKPAFGSDEAGVNVLLIEVAGDLDDVGGQVDVVGARASCKDQPAP